MKKLILLAATLFCCFFAKAQISSPDVLASGGGFASGPGFTNSFTLGQGSLPETFTTGTFILTQGFQQPADIGTGLAPVNETSALETYPNPTNGQFFLEYMLTENSDVVIEAFDVLGQNVFSETTSHASGKQISSVNLSSQSNGVYFVRCTIKNSSSITTHTSKITLTR
ncbi:MAG TPA: T9SS type A sorting domain-containing protein [Bacteroidia bacterium]|nr:T9SS type A sorting domain-containing protein [Bacteroidia bacterium]